MRARLVFLFMLSTISFEISYACPDLTGQYICLDENGEPNVEMTVQYDSSSLLPKYLIEKRNTKMFVTADASEAPMQSESFVGVSKYWCVENSLYFTETGVLYEENNLAGTLSSQSTFSLSPEGDFISKGQSLVKYGLEDYIISLDYKCQRQEQESYLK